MNRIDIAISIQSLSTKANAAVFGIAAKPFSTTFDEVKEMYVLNTGIDVLSCISKGMDIDPNMCKWWSKRPEDVKRGYKSAMDIEFAARTLYNYIDEVKRANNAQEATIWLQRADVYAPILRNIMLLIGKQILWHDIADVDTFITQNVRLLKAITFPDEFKPTLCTKGNMLSEVNSIIGDVTWIVEQYEKVLK